MSALVLFKLRGSARTKTKGSPVHPRSSFSSVAATSLPPLLLCCCCCAAASAVPRSAMHRGARSAMLIRTQCRVPKKSPASVFHFLHLAFWFDPGCWDPNSNSTSPPPLLLCCCCCATEKHRTTSSSFPTCKMSQGDAEPTCKKSQGDAELKGFVKCCWCCAAPSGAPPSAAPRSAILPKNTFRFGVPFPSFGVLVCPGVL